MTTKKPINLGQLLQSGGLGALADQARGRREMTARIKALLPADEAAHVVAATTNERGELVIAMDSAVWAARVRYRREQLGATQLRVRVAPLHAEPDDG
jgi:hypothetical protein